MMKMTNAMALTTAIEVLAQHNEYNEVVEKLQKMLVQTQKKSSAERKMTATQKENISLKDAIYYAMKPTEKYTITDLMKVCTEVSELSNQKVSALIRQMVLDGKLIREEIKRKAYFSLNLEI